ncbi:MAG: HAMP domain-containing histidine kinase [Candidatus Marinimicrobia bacterium]|nr:HAMP domain-containing histidine kinase [Candidatus Neomarinimicrobiota bacterium]MCF7829738.1 HAMP domain-containing histidine kinase [Candidatus Neomarinimicrobiota bacterium]MCF7881688.1 HAMP domain-containing histidine kinase [Candidatus Neomarinimicrobiota bacterium]
MKLRIKILLIVVGILALSLAALTVPLYWYTRSALETEFDQQMLTLLRLANEQTDPTLLATLDEEPDLPTIRMRLADQVRPFVIGGVRGIGFFSRDGNQLVAAGREFPEMSLLKKSVSGMKGTAESTETQVSEIFPIREGRYVKFAISPVHLENAETVYGVIWGEIQFLTFFTQLAGTLFWIALMAIVVAGVLGVLFARNLVRPVEKLATYASAISKNLSTPQVTLDRKDELGELSKALNEMHAEIRENEERNRELLSGIAHEIKNPLGGLEIYTGLLREDLAPDSEYAEYFRNISTSLSSLKHSVSSYLDYARPGKSNLKIITLSEVIRDVQHLVQPDLRGKNIQLHCNGDAKVRADESKVRRALLNVLNNSIESISESGKISITVTEEEDQVCLKISDTGSGIAPEDKESIFEPYFTTREKGYGLGLPIVKNMVEEMDGTIFVRSEVGQGTTVTMRFPGVKADE